MSYVWTKEDADKLRSARSHRIRYNPNDWQKLFHSDWQLLYQGDSAWLPETAKLTKPDSQLMFGNIVDVNGQFIDCASEQLGTRGIQDVLECAFCLQPARSTWRQNLERDKWLIFVDSYRERTTPEPPISIELSDAIQASRRILELPDDWDGEGTPRYSERALQRASSYLLRSAVRYWRKYQKHLFVPRILPGPDGNIDLHWKTPERELLISIPADPAELAAYYGDDRKDGTDNAIRGRSLDTSEYNDWIFAWLMR